MNKQLAIPPSVYADCYVHTPERAEDLHFYARCKSREEALRHCKIWRGVYPTARITVTANGTTEDQGVRQ